MHHHSHHQMISQVCVLLMLVLFLLLLLFTYVDCKSIHRMLLSSRQQDSHYDSLRGNAWELLIN